MKILIVDDEFVSRKKAQKILSQFAECDLATSGREALEAFVLGHYEKQPYDLMTLDILMPDMDGVNTLKKIREWEESHDIALGRGVKVLMLTSHKTSSLVLDSYKEGCEAYLVKPFDKPKLVACLKDLGFDQVTA